MGNVAEYCGTQRVNVQIGSQQIPIPIPRPRPKIVFKELLNHEKVKIDLNQKHILFKPKDQKIIDQKLLKYEDEVTKAVKVIQNIQNQDEKFKTMHYLMKQQIKTKEEVQIQTKKVQQAIKFSQYQERNLTHQGFQQLNDGFKSMGIDMNWNEKKGIASALSIHVLSGLTGNFVRCLYKQNEESRPFERLMDNKELLSMHHAQIKKKLSKKFDIDEQQITIVQIQKGSIKTTFVVNLDRIYSKIENENSIFLKSYQQLEIHPYFEHFRLSLEDFDIEGNYDYTQPEEKLSQQQKFKRKSTLRKGFIYNKPIGCKRYGLYVWDIYQNNDWITYEHEDQWVIAYHGVNSPGGKSNLPQNKDQKQIDKPLVLNSIMKQRLLKPGVRDMYKNRPCLSPNHKDCKSPKGGIYLSPDIDEAMNYASPLTIENNNGKSYRLAFQCRVHPKYTHIVNKDHGNLQYWIVQNSKYIRPYAIILRKELNDSIN